MPSDFEIGRVVAVDTAQLTIELNADLKALTRATYERTVEIGRVNSYVIVPVGARRIVAMVTRVVMTEESELQADRTMVALPSARRLMKATMIGTIESGEFHQGISLFPVLDSPVLVTTDSDLDSIFGKDTAVADPERPGYCIDVGTAVVFPDYKVRINPDAFFGKHAAVIGSTGSGKSCTIATIIQSILEHPLVKQTRFLVLDTNGEYRTAFQQTEAENWEDARPEYRTLYIPTDPNLVTERLVIPYWFMNSEDFVRLFRAAPNIQRPVLLDGLRLARSSSKPQSAKKALKDILVKELFVLIAQLEETGNTSAAVEDLARGAHTYIASKQNPLKELFSDGGTGLSKALDEVATEARKYVNEPAGRRFAKMLPLNVREDMKAKVVPFHDSLLTSGEDPSAPTVSADTPVYFSKEHFRHEYIEKAMRREEAGGARTKEHCATMLMRIYRLLDDRRFDFLFGPVDSEWPEPLNSLATFLRDILGLARGTSTLSDEKQLEPKLLPFYDRQRDDKEQQNRNVVIIDLSLLSAEILENITALIGRLLIDFLQRLSNTSISGIERGAFPVVLILEEAQNYIRERSDADESISREIFERIAREGRKFGLGLVVASQRPSELSKTVLSQCNSFVVHRLQNPEDLWYFKQIVPGIYEKLLDQLPALAPQHALVLGEAIRAPALVRVRDVDPAPRSKDPRFFEKWTAGTPPLPNVEAVCENWEGQKAQGDSEAGQTGTVK
jgi:hypothetical protein